MGLWRDGEIGRRDDVEVFCLCLLGVGQRGMMFVRAVLYIRDSLFAMKRDDNVYHEPLLSFASVPLHKRDTQASLPLFPQSGPAIDSRLELWDRLV